MVNICLAFRGAGLVALQLAVVPSMLDLQLRKPTPDALPEVLWEAEKPSNVREIDSPSALAHYQFRRHKSSSSASII